MQVEGTEARHLPHFLRKHAEGHDHKQISLERSKLGEEVRILEFVWLKHGDAMLYGILLHRALGHLEAAAGGLICHSNNANDLESLGSQGIQRSHSKLRRTHVDDTRLAEEAHHTADKLAPGRLERIHVEHFRVPDSLVGKIHPNRN